MTALKDPLAGIEETSAFDALPPVMSLDGGKGSGNFGHAGRPGKVGGSAQGGGSSAGAPEKAFTSKSKEGKIKKTKYAPSPQANYSPVHVSHKVFGQLRGALNTRYPNAKPEDGERYISHNGYGYVVMPDGQGSMSILKKWKL